MIKVQRSLLSVNQAWKGQRFKTDKYKQFEKDCLWLLPKTNIPLPPFEIHYHFAFSNKGSDLLNPEKLVTDILCKKYGFDDKDIFKMVLTKEIVEEGKEYFLFEILNYSK
jgi:hypothetical protein